MTEDEEEYVGPVDSENPRRGEIKMVRIKKNGVDSVELRLWNGSEWIDFNNYLNPGEDQ